MNLMATLGSDPVAGVARRASAADGDRNAGSRSAGFSPGQGFRHGQRGRSTAVTAFSLLEVMIAMALFFTAIFAILGLTSQNIGAAARLERHEVDIAGLAAELSLTNILQEGVESGDFGDLHPGVNWTRTITEVSSNGLFRVDFIVVGRPPSRRSRTPPSVETLSVLLYRPAGAGARGGLRR